MAQRLKNEIKEKILKNALDEFLEKGYKNTSMKVIAQESNIAVGNIYNYFKDKEELYSTLVRPVVFEINELFDEPPVKNDLQGLEKKIMQFLDIYKSNKEVFIMLLENSSNTKFEKLKVNIINNFSKAIQKWIMLTDQSGQHSDDGIFIKAFTTAYINGIISILAEDADEETKLEKLYEFLIFMRDGLFDRYKKGLGEK